MRATEFEAQHATLLHQLVVGAAFLTYLLERDDVVWRFIKNCPANRMLEHALFAFATFLVGMAAIICTRARVEVNGTAGGRQSELPPPASRTKSRFRGNFLYAIGLASLVPLTGFVILVLGEAIRISRLKRRSDALSRVGVMGHEQAAHSKTGWLGAFRREAIKWGIFVAMVAFTITLNDRVADILIILGWVLGLILVKTSFDPTL